MPRTAVTAADVAFYRVHGYVVIRNFLQGAEELEHWRAGVAAAVAERGPSTGGGAVLLPTIQGHPTLSDHPTSHVDVEQWTTKADTNDTGVFEQRVNLWMTNRVMRDLMLSPELGKMACTLAGVDGMRIWHDQTLIKAPWGMPTAIHIDNPNWSYVRTDPTTSTTHTPMHSSSEAVLFCSDVFALTFFVLNKTGGWNRRQTSPGALSLCKHARNPHHNMISRDGSERLLVRARGGTGRRFGEERVPIFHAGLP